ncbi:MAG: replication-relaxation family protein [Terriglobales bacterium]
MAEYYALTVKDLANLLYPDPKRHDESAIRRCLIALDRDGLVNRISYRPDDYPGYGTLPFACGLTFHGLCWAQENCAWTDPKELIKDHSPLTLEHEIKRARFHMKVVELAKKHKLELFWRKTDLNHTVKPDDVFAIKRDGKITYYFFELENKRKSFKEMLEKYRRYEDYYGTDKCKEEWKDFKTFTVVTQIRSHEALCNILKYLAGQEVTEFRNGKGNRIVNDHPINRNNFWFSFEEEPFKFWTPKDFEKVTYSFIS